MNREIKFRAWDKREKEMLYNPTLDWHGAEEKKECPFIAINGCYASSEIYELMQFTGLKDKNGKEVYEGDIIKHTNEEADHTPYEVPIICPKNWDLLNGIGDSEWDMRNNQYSNIEIIGNIYSSPEKV